MRPASAAPRWRNRGRHDVPIAKALGEITPYILCSRSLSGCAVTHSAKSRGLGCSRIRELAARMVCATCMELMQSCLAGRACFAAATTAIWSVWEPMTLRESSYRHEIRSCRCAVGSGSFGVRWRKHPGRGARRCEQRQFACDSSAGGSRHVGSSRDDLGWPTSPARCAVRVGGWDALRS